MDGYNIEYDDGKIVRVEAANAGNAIFRALSDYRGHRVKRCYRGYTGGIGYQEFDVPPHQAMEVKMTAERVQIKIPTRAEAFQFVQQLDTNTRIVRT